MTIKDILNQIEYTVIIDGKETPRDITFSTWMENMVRGSEAVSGYKPQQMLDPVARDNFQKYISIAYYAGLLPAKVTETRTNEVGEDGCWIFTVETSGVLFPETGSTGSDTDDDTDSRPDYTREEAERILKEAEEAEERAQALIAELRSDAEKYDYDYEEAVQDDVREYIRCEINLDEWKGNRDGLEEYLNDTLLAEDSVTGNASGSYTFSTWKAEAYLCHNLDLLQEAVDEFGGDLGEIMRQGAETADVTIRCYLLGQAISEALDELEEAGAFDEDDEADE